MGGDRVKENSRESRQLPNRNQQRTRADESENSSEKHRERQPRTSDRAAATSDTEQKAKTRGGRGTVGGDRVKKSSRESRQFQKEISKELAPMTRLFLKI